MVGSQVAHYRITAKLGAGGMGAVYLATDEKLGREVALKLLPDAVVADPIARARLVREAKTASALNHPGICHIYEVGESGGHSYIAMERVEGRTLSQSIPEGGLPPDTTLRYAEQLAEALAHAHDRGVLHRDLKSSNLMVTPTGLVKVLDFGLAKRVPSETEQATRSMEYVSQAASVAGTLQYLAPEVLRGDAADMRSDLWSLGVVLYEMASGKLPFAGRTGFEASAAILRESPAPLRAQVPTSLRAIINRCLAKEPAQRYQRAGELRAALEAIRSDSAVASVSASSHGSGRQQAVGASAPAQTPAASWRQPVLLSLVAVVLAAAGYVVWDNFFSEHARRRAGPPDSASPSAAALARLSTGGKPSPIAEANAQFEKAIFVMRGQFELTRARELFEKALEVDPSFAEARGLYAINHMLQVETGLSNETAWLYKAEQQAQQALEQDADCVAAQGALGAVYVMQGKKADGGRLLQRALERDPRHSVGVWLLVFHRLNGDYREGIALARSTLERSPVFWGVEVLLGSMLHQSGDTAGAEAEFRGVLDQDPQNHYALVELARGYLEAADTQSAREFLERIRPIDRQNYRVRLGWALLYAREGNRRDATREMDAEVLKYAELNPNVTLEAAEFYALLGETRTALDWLEKAVRNGDERVEWFQRDPLLEPIRSQPRFRDILDSVSFRRQQRTQ